MSTAALGASRAPATAMFQQLMLPLQSVVDFFSPPAPNHSFAGLVPAPVAQRAPIRSGVVGGRAAHSQGGPDAAQILRSRRAQDGRIVISGRMRDVCAELDRLCSDPA